MWAIIGGSGFEKFDEVTPVGNLDRATPFGQASSGLKKVKVKSNGQSCECIFLPRHGERHELLPSEVNYCANIFALKRHGASKLLAFSAVGSLREELKPGDMVIPHQFIDRTKSLRRSTFCGNGVVGHVALAHPIWQAAAEMVRELRPELSFSVHFAKTSLCIEGPYFSTRAESHSYRALGVDIIGMTAFPEFALAREAGLAYLPCSFVTDYDSWNEAIAHVTLDGVLELMRQNNGKAFQLLQKILTQNIALDPAIAAGGLRTGLMTPLASLSPEQRAWLEVLQ